MLCLRSLSALLCLLVVLLAGCGRQYEANATWQTEIDGVCEVCPVQRIDTLLRDLPGVLQVSYDSTQQLLRVAYDSTAIRPPALVIALNDAGYDAGENPTFLPSLLDACCLRGGEDLLSMLNPQDTLGLSPVEKEALLDSLRQVLLGEYITLDQLMEDLDEEPDLDQTLERDLLGQSYLDETSLELMPDVPGPSFDELESQADDDEIVRGLETQEAAPPAAAPRRTPAKPKPAGKP